MILRGREELLKRWTGSVVFFFCLFLKIILPIIFFGAIEIYNPLTAAYQLGVREPRNFHFLEVDPAGELKPYLMRFWFPFFFIAFLSSLFQLLSSKALFCPVCLFLFTGSTIA